MTSRRAMHRLSEACGLICKGYKRGWSTRGILVGPRSPTSNNTGGGRALSSDSQHATAHPGCRADSDRGRSPSEQPAVASGEQAADPSMSPKDMIAVFTCKSCDTRSAKPFSRQAYDTGVVIIQCPGCQARHLIADRLGWFGQMGSVEDFLAEHGEKAVRKREDGTLELTPEDIMGSQRQQ